MEHMLQLDIAGEACSVNNLCMLTMLCSVQMPVFKARDYISPLIPTTTVLLTQVKLLKRF